MDLDDVKAITDFLTRNVYPSNFGINDKRSLRQKAKSFTCCAGEFMCSLILKNLMVFQFTLSLSSLLVMYVTHPE
jgi:hypothetical protein